jgi:hypothetical protein
MLRQILWAERCGMAWLMSRADALPTGLPGRFSCLTRLPRISYFTSGALDRSELFEPVSFWRSFEARITPGNVVNHEVHELLDKLLTKPPDCQALQLSDVLKWELPPSRDIDPNIAGSLGVVINRDLLNRLESDQTTKGETPLLRELLDSCHFRSRAGTWVLAEDLVGAGDQSEVQDERLRAAFAPPEHVLNGNYREAAVDFFRACRFRLKASSDLLATGAAKQIGRIGGKLSFAT